MNVRLQGGLPDSMFCSTRFPRVQDRPDDSPNVVNNVEVHEKQRPQSLRLTENKACVGISQSLYGCVEMTTLTVLKNSEAVEITLRRPGDALDGRSELRAVRIKRKGFIMCILPTPGYENPKVEPVVEWAVTKSFKSFQSPDPLLRLSVDIRKELISDHLSVRLRKKPPPGLVTSAPTTENDSPPIARRTFKPCNPRSPERLSIRND